MGPAVQLTFQLRTSANVRTVHLVGSWDNYNRQLPLSAINDGNAKPGSWKGRFRFQGSQALQLGSRYWYYYIVDGYHVSHDPAKDSVVEKTTGRRLNILDVPGSLAKPTSTRPMMRTGLSLQTTNLPSSRPRRTSDTVPYGRALSPGKIQCPRPQKPYASRGLREADYDRSPIDDLEERFAGTHLSDRMLHFTSSPSTLSDASSASGDVFSSPASTSPSSCSSAPPECKCERYGVTRDGRRIKLDCGGKRCGIGDSSSSECASGESDRDSSEDDMLRAKMRARVATKTTTKSSTRRVTVAKEKRSIRR